MNPRTKLELIGAATAFGLYATDQLYRSQIEQPSSNLNAELDGLTKKLQANKESQALARTQTQRLETHQLRSLPSYP